MKIFGRPITEDDIPRHDWYDHEDRTVYMWVHIELGTITWAIPSVRGIPDVWEVLTDTGIAGIYNARMDKFLTIYPASEKQFMRVYNLMRGKGNELPLPTEALKNIRAWYKDPVARKRMDLWGK